MRQNDKKPKIMFIGPYPPPYSGPELGMKLFLESELQKKYRIYFLKTNFRKSNENKGRLDIGMFAAFFPFVIRLFLGIVLFRPKVAYYPITTTQVGWIGRDLWCILICKIFSIKTIIHLRGGHFRQNYKQFNIITKYLIKVAFKSISIAIVQANNLKGQFKGFLPCEKITVLYNAIRSEEYDNQNRNVYNSKQVLFMGHMTKAKGYCDLVRAIPIIAKRIPNAILCFAGTLRKGERGVFFNQATGAPIAYEDPFVFENNILSGRFGYNYKNIGIVSGDEKKRLLRDSAIFVLPSYSEGFSRSILEAMSVGKPVVCTPVGAHREIIREGVHGFFVSPGNVEQLADRIIKLLENEPLRRKISETNYRYVRGNFDISIIASRFENIIDRLLHEIN